MLYQQWRQTAASRAANLALRDLATGRQWTFAQLAAEAERPGAGDGPLSFPSGTRAEFVMEVLRAWRKDQVVCPLEPGQAAPGPKGLPPGIVHLKATSASTGPPRWVGFTAAQLEADAENIVQTMGLRPNWPNLGLISLAHSYGFSNLVLPLLLHGIPLTLAAAALPEALRYAAETEREITIAAVPALWRTWLEAGAIPGNLRLAISAGAPLPLELEREVFAHHQVKIHNFYGSSECGGIAYDSSPVPRLEAACVGAPLKNVKVSVAPDGCIEVRSRAVARGYWPEPAPRLNAGVFRTGDLGELTGGLVYLRGRASDRINIAGRKVVPDVIEQAVMAHPQVRACLAFGVPSAHGGRGETIVVCVAARSEITSAALKRFVMARLPAWQVPREWWLVPSLEVNGRGKLSRSDWRKRFMQRSERTRAEGDRAANDA